MDLKQELLEDAFVIILNYLITGDNEGNRKSYLRVLALELLQRKLLDEVFIQLHVFGGVGLVLRKLGKYIRGKIFYRLMLCSAEIKCHYLQIASCLCPCNVSDHYCLNVQVFLLQVLPAIRNYLRQLACIGKSHFKQLALGSLGVLVAIEDDFKEQS